MLRPGTRKKRTVLFVDSSVGFGGAIKSLALTLRELAITPVLATSQDAGLVRRWLPGVRLAALRRIVNYRSKERAEAWVSARARSALLRAAAGKLIGIADLLATAGNVVRLAWLIRRRRVDLIHLNNGFRPPEGLIVAALTRVPCVVHVRGFDFGRDAARSRWARAVRAVIAVSESVADSVRTVSTVQPLVIVHDPVDTVAITRAAVARDRIRQQHSVTDADVLVAIYGRVVRWKGHTEFVAAVLAAMDRDASIKALVVGDESDGTRTYHDHVVSTIRASAHAHRFVVAGFRANVEEYYAATDIVVHASILPEPFGMVITEGMAAGCAVIATNAGGPREIITDGVDGLLVPAADTAAMSRAIIRLAADAPLRRELGANARRTAVRRFHCAVTAAAVQSVYEQVLPTAPLDSPRLTAARAS